VTTVLVTGASGFLGSHFLDWLIRNKSDDLDLWCVDLNPHPLGIPYDHQDLGLWLEDFDVDCDLVFHMAAPVGGREKIEGDPLYNADSLRLDSALFRWAVKHAKTVVYPSSSAVYGTVLQDADGQPMFEGQFDPSGMTWLAPDEMYGFTKLAGEVLAWKSVAYGLNALCIRPFSGYGEGQSFEYPVPSIARRALHRENPLTVWGPGTQRRDFIHVDDLVAATMARLERPVEGYEALNLGSGRGTDFDEVARICAEVVGYSPHILHRVDKPVGVTSRVADVTRMRQFYEPKVGLREGLERVVNFIRSFEEAAGAQDDQD